MKSRHDMYKNVHKGLRRELANLLADAGALDPADRAETTAIAARWDRVKALLHAHNHHEDAFIGPHLARHAPPLFVEMERDHASLDEEIAALDEAQKKLCAGGEDGARGFYLGLAAFVGHYFLHMDREERVLVFVLQAVYTDAELAAIEAALVASIEPALLTEFFAAMLPAMNPGEREELLAGVRSGAPQPVFEHMCNLSQSVLSAPAWATLEARLSASPVEVKHA